MHHQRQQCLFSFNSELSVLQAQEAALRSIHAAPWQNKCELARCRAILCSTVPRSRNTPAGNVFCVYEYGYYAFASHCIVLFVSCTTHKMSYVLVDVNMFRNRELPTTLQTLSAKVQVEGTTELTRTNTSIPCIKAFSTNASALNVRPGIGVLCSVPSSEECPVRR